MRNCCDRCGNETGDCGLCPNCTSELSRMSELSSWDPPAPRESRCACDCRRTPKILLSISALILFGCALIVPILDIPMYSAGSPLTGQQGFSPFYYAPMAPQPDAYAHVYLTHVRACINSNNPVTSRIVDQNNGTACSPYKSLLFAMDNNTLTFEIGHYKVMPGPNAEYFANPTIMITGTLALTLLCPLLLIATLFYLVSLCGLKRRHYATAGAVVGFAIILLGIPITLYAFTVDSTTSIDLVDQVGIHQSSQLGGILMFTAMAIHGLLIWSTCICCCCCAPKSRQTELLVSLNDNNAPVRYDANAESKGVKCREAVFNIILWMLCIAFWIMLLAFPFCSYIPQCPSQYLPNQNNCGPNAEISCQPTDCQQTMCLIFQGTDWLYKAFGPIWFVQIVVAYFSPAAKALRNSRNRVGTKAYVNRLKRQSPYLWFHIQCFQIIETTYTDRNGYSTTTTRRVDTHSASGHFVYTTFIDSTSPLIIPGTFHLVGAPTRIHADKDYSFANDASQREFDRQLNNFVALNHIVGHHKEVTHGMNIDGFSEYSLAFQQNDDLESPAYFLYIWHFLSSIFALSPLYEFIFYAESTSAQLHVRKIVLA